MSAQVSTTARPLAGNAPRAGGGRKGWYVAGAVVVIAAAVGAALLATHKSGPGAAPYSDPAAVGSIALCSSSGKPVTGGAITDRPLAASALGSTAGAGGDSAALYAYQPRAGVDPAEWSGLPLTSGAKVADPAHPALQLTGKDTSLAQFVAGYPATDKGFVQLRLYLASASGQHSTYDSADIKISGQRWQLVGTPATCTH